MNSFAQIFNIEDSSQFINSLLNSLASGALKVLVILIYALLSWWCIRLLSFLIKRLLIFSKIERLQQHLSKSDFWNRSKIKLDLVLIIDAFIKVFLVLIFIVVGADLFGLEIVSAQIGIFVSLMPQFFISVIIFVSGLYLALWVKKALMNFFGVIGFKGAKIIGKMVFYVLFLFFTIIALNQAGINTDIITHNISIIMGGIFITIALSLGLGSKEMVTLLLYSFYTRKNLRVGMRIRIEQMEGVIVSIDNIYLCLLVHNHKILMPIKKVSSSTIEFLDNQ
ncbi:hypothetical protein [Flavobacterium sp. NKUCC04_CG]|uniref:hypothetical protein n=1 Tax=Flavobacterium sp. NKUCC04_CG TaxID=2842121 RepID=UPI001C5BE4EC|nr:hypothetical protein [Flavobacterium sp. NKUCC04_CG]MBW3520271.1 hypothetical protein [Flavobacterium sp. NKUCC04_CG]